jgi:protein transport protein SEC61 subunit gamma-like protein
MDQVMQFVDPARQFAKDSIRLVKKCTKPDRKGEEAKAFLS